MSAIACLCPGNPKKFRQEASKVALTLSSSALLVYTKTISGPWFLFEDYHRVLPEQWQPTCQAIFNPGEETVRGVQ
jgi:hypothetical protein